MLHAGIVDEDVDRADVRLEGVDGLAHSLVVGGVEGERVPCPEVSCGGRELGGVAAVQDDLGAGRGKTLGQRVADALRGAGDEGALARQVEEFGAHSDVSLFSQLRTESRFTLFLRSL